MTIFYKAFFLFFVVVLSCVPPKDPELEDVVMPDDVIKPKKVELPKDVVLPEGYGVVETVYITKTIGETLTVVKEIPTLVEKIIQSKKFTVQIGAFRDKNNAINMYEKLKNTYNKIYIIETPPFWKVRIGGYYSKEEAINIKEKIKKEGFRDAFIVPL